MDGGAWWAAVYGVAQSQTRLKRLSSSKYMCRLPWWLRDKKNPSTNAGDMGLIPGSGRSPRVGNGNLFQYSFLGKKEEPGGLQSMVAQRVRHNLVCSFPFVRCLWSWDQGSKIALIK